MPRLVTYVKNNVIEEISKLVEDDINAGANPAEVSISSKSGMLLELGLRVYKIRQSEQVGSGRDEFDQIMFESVLETMYLAQHLTKTIAGMNNTGTAEIKATVKGLVKNKAAKFFPEMDGEETKNHQ